MADGITIPVSAPGLAQTASGFDALGQRATAGTKAVLGASAGVDKMSKSMEVLQNRLRSGEVIRNAAASFAIMASGAGDATDKLTALSASLSSIPGPVGGIAAAFTVGLVVFKSFQKEAAAAKAEIENLGKALATLGKERAAGLEAVADRISSAALKIGQAIRASSAQGATRKDIDRMQELAGGDPNRAMDLAGRMAESGLTDADQEAVIKRLERVRAMGETITAEAQARAIAQQKERVEAAKGEYSAEDVRRTTAEAGARGGGMFAGGYNLNGPREKMSEADAIVDIINPSSGDRSRIVDRLNRSMLQSSYAEQARLREAEQPIIADSTRTIKDATGGGGTMREEALIASTLKNTTSTDSLTKAVRDLDETIIKTTKAQGEAKRVAYSGWRSWFNGDEPATSP